MYIPEGRCYLSRGCIVAGSWRRCGLARLPGNVSSALRPCPTANTVVGGGAKNTTHEKLRMGCKIVTVCIRRKPEAFVVQ